MSQYTNGWTWDDSATDEQRADPANKAAIDRLYQEIRQLYNGIPDPEDERTQERLSERFEAIAEDRGHEAAKAAEAQHKEGIRKAWGEIEAVEQLINQRGGRLKEDYEHHNEFAGVIASMEREGDADRD